jgi:hypothetical protein
MTFHRRYTMLSVLLFIVFAFLWMEPQPAKAGGLVSTCSEAALNTALIGGGLVDFAIGAPCTIFFTSTKNIGFSTTIQNTSGFSVTFNGNNALQLFFVNGGVAFSLSNITLTSGISSVGGAVYLAGGNLLSTNYVTFSNNRAMNGGPVGGAIYAQSGSTLIINNTIFTNNVAQNGYGGAIMVLDSTANIATSTFNGNNAIYGGAIHLLTGGNFAMNVTGNTFTGNNAPNGMAGAILVENYGATIPVISRNTFTNNVARDAGGALVVFSNATITSNSFIANTLIQPGRQGGAIYLANGTTKTISNNTFSGNSAPNGIGGAIYNGGSTAILTHNTFHSNIAQSGGGHLYAAGGSTQIRGDIFFNGTCAGGIMQMGFVAVFSSPGCPGSGIDPMFGPLTGGVYTPTNLAVEYPPGCYIATDQLNVARPQGANCTLGSVEIAGVQTRTVQFASISGSANEASGVGNVLRVTTSDFAPIASPITLTIGVTGGTAIMSDYILTGTISIPAGTPHNSIISIASGFAVMDDNTYEADDTVQLTISAPVNASLGGQTNYLHTIINDEVARVHASPTTNSTNESLTPYNAQFTLTIVGTTVGTLVTDLPIDFTVSGLELGAGLTDALDPEDFTASPSTFTFPIGTLSGGFANATVAIVNDDIDEQNEWFDVKLATVTNAILPPDGDPTYDNSQTVTILDNDMAGYLVNTGATTNITEPNIATTFTIRLMSQPAGTVVLDFASTDITECSVSPASFTFDNLNWNVAQTITITAVDEFLVDGSQPCATTITQNMSSTATEYALVANPANVGITVNDNDAPATITITSGDPQSTVVNTPFGAPLVVQVQNGSGQFVEGATVTFTPPVAGTSAVIIGSPATTDINGFASVTATANTVAGIYNVVVTSGAAPSVNFILENTAGTATNINFAQQPSNAVAGVAIAPAVAVLVTDGFSNPISGQNVTLTLSTGTGILSGTVTQATNTGGIATFADLSINLIGGKNLTATAGALTVISNPFTITASTPTSISYSQQPTDAIAGVTIAPAVAVTLLDGFGNPVSGQNVTLTLSTGTGALGGTATQMTDGSGIATFPDLSINLVGGKNLTATAGALTVISNPFTITVSAPAIITFAQQPTDAVAGATIAPAVTVSVTDAFTNPIIGANITLNLSTGTGVLSGTLTQMTDGSGIATFADLSINLVGSKNITATSGALNVVSSPFNIIANAPATITFVQQPTNAVAGVSIAPAVTVLLTDIFGNPIIGANITLNLSTGTGILSGTVTQVTNGSGVATFPDLSINLVGGKNLTATAGALTVISNPFTITVSTPAIITFAQQPSNAVAGMNIAPAVTVSLTDIFGNPIIGANITLNLSIGTGVLSGTLTQMTDGVGVATFPDLSINLIGSKNLTATAGALTVISNAFTITASTPTNISYSQQPSNAVAGVTIAPAVTVMLFDGFGNPVSGQNVTLSLSTGVGVLSGTVTQATDGVGVATFPDLSINLVGGKNLTATAGALTVISNPFTITVSAPAIITFAQQPSNATAGVTIAPAVTVSLTDTFGNPIIGQNVTLTLSTGTGVLSGTLTQTTDGVGVATFPDLSINLIGVKNITATASALNVISNPFTITSASASNISYSQQPTDAVAGATIAPAVTVTILDGLGNPVSGANVTLSLTTGTGVLGGTVTQMTDGAGVATFPDLNINLIGSKNLTATSGALTVVSNPFIITAPTGSGSGLVIVSGNPQQTATSTAFALPMIVRVTDTFGNPVAGETVNFVATVDVSGATASLSAPTVTDINGETSVIATANGIVGAYTVDATLGTQTVIFTLANLDPNDLTVAVACVDANLVVTIVSGSGNFDITAPIYGIGMPLVNVSLGAYTFPGPETWLGITVAELGGDNQVLLVGNVSCDALSPTTNIPVPMDPNAIGCVLTANVVAPDAPDNTYCRVLMRDGTVVDYSGAVPQSLIDLGVAFAVDIYRLEGGQAVTTFPDYTQICLSGAGRMFYLDARLSPRDITEMLTEAVDNMTCAWIPATGTLVLTNR